MIGSYTPKDPRWKKGRKRLLAKRLRELIKRFVFSENTRPSITVDGNKGLGVHFTNFTHIPTKQFLSLMKAADEIYLNTMGVSGAHLSLFSLPKNRKPN